MSNIGLSVSDIIRVSVSLSPTPSQTRSFGSLLILGDSPVIDIQTRLRQYSGIEGIGADFGTAAPEYQAALEFFGQTPQPATCFIGRWASSATSGRIEGAALGFDAQAIANFTGVANGGIDITIDGTPHALSGIDLTGVTNLNGVAAAIQTALAGAGTVVWDANNNKFVVRSTTSGVDSTVLFATVGSGTDLSVLTGLAASVNGSYAVAGSGAETLAEAVNALLSNGSWYGLTFAATTMPTDQDYVGVSKIIQAASPVRVLGITSNEAGLITDGVTTDIASLITGGSNVSGTGSSRTFIQYSSSSPYAAAAAFGLAFSTNFLGAATLYTLMFKQESGIIPEALSESQAVTAKNKNANIFVNYNNGVPILQHGTMSDGTFFDVIHGTDWLQNEVQTAIFNLLLTSRKIPQTDAGVNQIVTTICNRLDQAVTNGLVAPGDWQGPSFGAIVTGQTLTKGYYVYAPPVSTQSQAARAARQAPVITAAIKLAGAIHEADIIINVNA